MALTIAPIALGVQLDDEGSRIKSADRSTEALLLARAACRILAVDRQMHMKYAAQPFVAADAARAAGLNRSLSSRNHLILPFSILLTCYPQPCKPYF